MKAMRQWTRRRKLHLRSDWSLPELARALEPRVRGWVGYYCRFRGSEFQPVARQLDDLIVRWAMRKYKRFRDHKLRAYSWLVKIKRIQPGLFFHWSGQGSFMAGTMGAR